MICPNLIKLPSYDLKPNISTSMWLKQSDREGEDFRFKNEKTKTLIFTPLNLLICKIKKKQTPQNS